MKILIFGTAGMLGHKLIQVLGRDHEVWSTCRGPFSTLNRREMFRSGRVIEGVDASDMDSVSRALEIVGPEVVINAAGVIKQLPSSKDVTTSLVVNSLFPNHIARSAEAGGFRFITVSTDCVFDGRDGNYKESDVPNALDLYGQSKRWGEVYGKNCLTLRTSIIGHELGSHHSLVDWFLTNRGGTVKGYSNAIYSGFPTVVFADIIGDLIVDHPSISGLYHVSSDPISKLDLLRLINEIYDLKITIEPSEEVRIDRSLDSSRFRAETGFKPVPWREMIQMMKNDVQLATMN